MRSIACVILAIAACGGVGTPPPSQPASQPPAAVRATPAQTIRFADNTFEPRGLPAIAHASEVAVFAVRDSDGGRGYPNLRVEVRDRDDKVLQTLPVMSANEYETLVADRQPTPALAARLAAVDAELAKLHGVHDLVAMRELETVRPTNGDLQHMCTGDGFDVDFRGNQLAIFHHNSQRPLVERETSAWQPAPRLAGGEACTNPAFLRAAYHARGISAVVVEIGFHGSDLCWEPGDQFHVVTW